MPIDEILWMLLGPILIWRLHSNLETLSWSSSKKERPMQSKLIVGLSKYACLWENLEKNI